MKLKQHILIIFLFFLSLLRVNAVISDSTLIKYIENKTIKNILIFRIKTTSIVENDLHDKFLKPYVSFFDVLPDNDCKLVLEVKKIDIQYPDTSIKLYSIFKNHDQYDCGAKVIEPSFSYFPIDRYFLIGINKKNEIKFISGNFFLSAIKNDFKLDINDPYSFFEYLKFKTYYLQIKDLKFIKQKKKQFIFEAYALELDKTVNIIVSLDDIEDIVVNYYPDDARGINKR